MVRGGGGKRYVTMKQDQNGGSRDVGDNDSGIGCFGWKMIRTDTNFDYFLRPYPKTKYKCKILRAGNLQYRVYSNPITYDVDTNYHLLLRVNFPINLCIFGGGRGGGGGFAEFGDRFKLGHCLLDGLILPR